MVTRHLFDCFFRPRKAPTTETKLVLYDQNVHEMILHHIRYTVRLKHDGTHSDQKFSESSFYRVGVST